MDSLDFHSASFSLSSFPPNPYSAPGFPPSPGSPWGSGLRPALGGIMSGLNHDDAIHLAQGSRFKPICSFSWQNFLGSREDTWYQLAQTWPVGRTFIPWWKEVPPSFPVEGTKGLLPLLLILPPVSGWKHYHGQQSEEMQRTPVFEVTHPGALSGPPGCECTRFLLV